LQLARKKAEEEEEEQLRLARKWAEQQKKQLQLRLARKRAEQKHQLQLRLRLARKRAEQKHQLRLRLARKRAIEEAAALAKKKVEEEAMRADLPPVALVSKDCGPNMYWNTASQTCFALKKATLERVRRVRVTVERGPLPTNANMDERENATY